MIGDLIVVFDAHTQSVDKNRHEDASLKYIAVHTSLHQTTKPLPNVCIVYTLWTFLKHFKRKQFVGEHPLKDLTSYIITVPNL